MFNDFEYSVASCAMKKIQSKISAQITIVKFCKKVILNILKYKSTSHISQAHMHRKEK